MKNVLKMLAVIALVGAFAGCAEDSDGDSSANPLELTNDTPEASNSGDSTPQFLTITAASPSDGMENGEYTESVAVANGTAPYAWSVLSGALPDGLEIDSSTGHLSGVALASGTFDFTIGVTDAVLATATVDLSIVILPQIASYDSLPFITNEDLTRFEELTNLEDLDQDELADLKVLLNLMLQAKTLDVDTDPEK